MPVTDGYPEAGEVAANLCTAEPDNTAEAYQELGLRLTYQPDRYVIRATARPKRDNLVKWLVSEGRVQVMAWLSISLVKLDRAK